MDFQTAVKTLAGQISDDIIYTERVKVLAGHPSQDVEFTSREMAIKVISEATGADGDWIAAGDWSGNETVESVIAEWEEINA
jgi:hypothetical protein